MTVESVIGIIFGCIFLFGVISFGVYTIFLKSLFKKSDKDIQAEQEALQRHHQLIREDGRDVAPAVVIVARVLEKLGRDRFSLEYEVDVTLNNGSLLRKKIIDEYSSANYSKNFNEMTSERGRKIWVIFDPKDLSTMYVDHFGVDHFDIGEREAKLDQRRIEFNKIMTKNEELKIHGEPAEAIISQVDDLGLPYPRKNSHAVHLYFDIMTGSGETLQAEGDSLMMDSAIEKYSVGKKVYVRYDRQNPKWAVLDTERNKSIK